MYADLGLYSPMTLTEEDKKQFESANSCCVCERPFTANDRNHGRIVRHHNHLTSKYIGAHATHVLLTANKTNIFFHL